LEGTYEELQMSNLDFAKMLRFSKGMVSVTDDTLNVGNKIDKKLIFDRQMSEETNIKPSVDESKIHKDKLEPTEIAETRSSGNISYTVYLSYLFAGGRKRKILFFILICIFTQVFSSIGDFWISYWYGI
jgi:ATP-binding cassette, subfamily C (CFTR/MRP), member 4